MKSRCGGTKLALDKRSKAVRVGLVTGAAGAIGGSVVRRLIGNGWRVAGIDLKECEADLSLCVDVTDRTAMVEAVRQVMEKLGSIQLLVTAAGDLERIPFGEMKPDRWRRMLDVWLGGTANACAAVVPKMVEEGSGTVVTLSADLSQAGSGYVYAAAASGTVVAYSKSFGCEVAPHGVRVNCIAPPLPMNPDWVAATVDFLANDGGYYASQVFSPSEQV
jgi:2-hydroxycyclohexanecarboxyl-CoA dehydrogenase